MREPGQLSFPKTHNVRLHLTTDGRCATRKQEGFSSESVPVADRLPGWPTRSSSTGTVSAVRTLTSTGERVHNRLVLIVAGHLIVDPADRDAQIQASTGAVRLARQAPGCLDFAVSADPVDPARVNVLERWERTEDLEAFRNSDGDPDTEPVDFSRIRRFEVEQYTVTD